MREFIIFLFLSLGFIFPKISFAQTYTFEVTQGLIAGSPPVPGVGSVFFVKNFEIQYHGGKVWLSGSPDGTGSMNFADTLQLVKTPSGVYTYNAAPGCLLQQNIPPKEITSYFTLFNLGLNSGYVRLIDWCGRQKNIGPIYITEIVPTATPTPTPTMLPSPSPTPTPSGPAPFLDLPWDYEKDGLTFSEAALSINSYFDHEYPLLSSGLDEPEEVIEIVRGYDGEAPERRPYTRHDGYDYGKSAKVFIHDPVLAAGDGIATFSDSCGPCGNMILIDHENGYQTRYLHLGDKGIFEGKEPGTSVRVVQGDVIGKVGASGNVIPKGELGAHIHFGLFHDKNADGNFGDNIPDGATDPFGWWGEIDDPWEMYTFLQHEHPKVGNKSYYLWEKSIESIAEVIGPDGGEVTSERNTVKVPSGVLIFPLTFTITPEPRVAPSASLQSTGTSFSVIAKDSLGKIVNQFNDTLDVIVDFEGWDLSRFDPSTLSIYSSQNGQEWNKENTIFNYQEHTATAKVDHLTHFALMGERIDTTDPSSYVVLNGIEGESGWYRSDVGVELVASDGLGGSGVDYTYYNLDQMGWELYSGEIVVAEEGNHNIEYYSVDNDENIEEIKKKEFIIDVTPPTIEMSVSPTTIWPPNGKKVPVTIQKSAYDKHLDIERIFILDEYNDFIPEGIGSLTTVYVEARKAGSDIDGRRYILKFEAIDLAGNQASLEQEVRVLHDQGN